MSSTDEGHLNLAFIAGLFAPFHRVAVRSFFPN